MDNLKNQILRDLSIKDALIMAASNEEALVELISQYVQELIDHDFEKLLYLLYRLDVSEYKVKNAIEANGPKDASSTIARMILEREKQKVESRKKYSTGNTDDWIFNE